MVQYTDKVPGRTILANGLEYIYFGGTSYLGLDSDPRFQELLLSNFRTYGMHYGASRLSNLRLAVYESTERHLAAWAGSPDALTVSSGYLAGQLVSGYFNNEAYRIFAAPNAHAALICPGAKRYGSFSRLADDLRAHLSGAGGETPVIFMDSIDFSGNTYPDYSALRPLPLQQLILVADDSHGLGILGEAGGGAYNALARLPFRELLVCGSLGKALGLQGGVVLGSRERLASLRESSLYAGASPAPPAHMATLAGATALYAEKRRSLLLNVSLFENECRSLGRFSRTNAYPVYCFDDEDLTTFLLASGVFVTDFRYPSAPYGTLPGRIVLSAHHSDQDIIHLAGLLNSYYSL
jgi:8-amino-7-oxononanoate synthase